MVALSDNGHSEDHPFLFRQRHNSLPCALYHFSDGFYVVRARPACETLLGAKLIAIDGHPMDQVADRMFAYVRGPRNHFDAYSALLFLQSPALLNAAGLANDPGRVTLGVQMPDGTGRDMPMTADPADPKWPWWPWPDSYLSPQPIAGQDNDRKDWKPLLPADAPRDPYFLLGLTAAVLSIGLLLFWLIRRGKKPVSDRTLLTLALVFCTLIPWLLPSMHERYFYMADVLAVCYAVANPKRFFVAPMMVYASYAGYNRYLHPWSTAGDSWYLFGGHPGRSLTLPSLLILGVAVIALWDLRKQLREDAVASLVPYGREAVIKNKKTVPPLNT